MEEGFEEELFTGIDALRRQCKDFCFKNKILKMRILNTAQLMCGLEGGASTGTAVKEELSDIWGEDPVHPSEQAFARLASNVLELLSQPTNIASTQNAGPSGTLTGRAAKRPRWLEEQAASEIKPRDMENIRGRGRGRPRGGHRRY